MSGYDNGAGNRALNQRGNTTRTLLLVLLLVIAGGGYVYYFTDLIRPQSPPAPPVAAPVKNPIPPRADQGGPGAGTAPVAAVAPPAAPAAPPAAAPSTKPAQQPQPDPSKAKGADQSKPASPPPAAAPAKAPAAPAKATPAPPVAPAKATPAPAAPVKAPAVPAKADVAPAKKEVASTKAPAKGDKAAPQKKGAYALLVGDFVPDKTLADVLAKLKKNGVSPVRKQIVASVKPMNRLFIDEFAEQERAESELQQLKRITSDAFLIANDRTYTLYAGSYYTDAKLKAAKQRLEAKGIKPVIRKANIAVKMARITAGSFTTSEEAGKASQVLKKAGLNAKVVKTGP